MRGVFVLGVGRSGTSMLTRLINLLGVPMCVETDLLAPGESNPAGFWESGTVVVGNEMLLALLDGEWNCPPLTAEIAGAVRPPVHAAYAAAFRTVHPTDEWVCKDPRLCCTLPIWREALGIDPVVVLAVRHPSEVAQSLTRQVGIVPLIGLALWERYTRSVLQHAAGLAVVVAPMRPIVARPEEWCARMSVVLRRHGFALTSGRSPEEASVFSDASLIHAAAEPIEMSPSQQVLFEIVESLTDIYDRFPAIALPPETPRTGELIARAQSVRRRHGFPGLASPRFSSLPANEAVAAMHAAVSEIYAARSALAGAFTSRDDLL